MILLKKRFKLQHISQYLCNHSKVQVYYCANHPKHKNKRIKGRVVYDVYEVFKCCKCGKVIFKNKITHSINVNQLHYKFGITI